MDSSAPSRLLRRCKLCRRGPSDVLNTASSRSKPIPPDPLLDTLFSAISSLKSAYIAVQQAHLPYHPDKLRAADALIVAELQSLSHLSHHHSPSAISAALHSKTQSLDSQLHRLKLELRDIDHQNAELDLLLYSLQHQHQHLTPSLFSNAIKLASDSIHAFAKPLIAYMKASGWNLDSAADAIESSIVYSERSHKKYAFEAYLSRALFLLGGGNDLCCFDMKQFDRIMSFQDAFDALLDDPDSGFARFCRAKYLAAVHPKMERAFFDDLDQRRLVLRGGHPRTPFYRAFVRMTKWVWVVLALARSFIPEAGIFCARKGQVYAEEYMESVVDLKGSRGERRFTVGLTVMPGFKIGRDVVRCRVYLCSAEPSC